MFPLVKVDDALGTWDWIEETFLPNLYYSSDYRQQPVNVYNEKFIRNAVGLRLGPPRLRQVRVKPSKMWLDRLSTVFGKVCTCSSNYVQ